jgi:hypothetical protein
VFKKSETVKGRSGKRKEEERITYPWLDSITTVALESPNKEARELIDLQ